MYDRKNVLNKYQRIWSSSFKTYPSLAADWMGPHHDAPHGRDHIAKGLRRWIWVPTIWPTVLKSGMLQRRMALTKKNNLWVYIYIFIYIYFFIHTNTTHYITITYMVLLCITSLVASAIPHKLVTWGTSTGVPLWWSFITLVTHLLHCILPLSPRQNVNQHQSRLLYVHDYRLFMMIVWNCMIIDYCALLYTIIHSRSFKQHYTWL